MRAIEQPPDVAFSTDDGIFIKQMFLREAGTIVPQHSHKYDHTSLLARGSVRMWRNEALVGDLVAPQPIPIKAGCKHTFLSLEPDTLIYCIHNITRSGEVEIVAEHQLGDLQCHGDL